MEDILPLLAVAVYWLFRAMRGSQKKKAAARPPSPDGRPKAPTPFEQMMAQLEQVLEEPKADVRDSAVTPQPRRDVEPPRPVERQAERPPAPRAVPRPPRAVPIGFDSEVGDYQGFEHDRHGFGQENPLSEEVFEQRPRFAPRPKTASKRLDARNPASPPAPAPRAVSWATRLRDPAAAREALVLKTIFEGPWKPRSGRPDQ